MIKDIKVSLRMEDGDYTFKLAHAIRFLQNKDQVRITVMFKGREISHKELGEKELLKLAADLEIHAKAEFPWIREPRKLYLMFTPK